MLSINSVLFLGIVLLLSKQHFCVFGQNFTDEILEDFGENEKETTLENQLELQIETLEDLQNQSKTFEDIVQPESFKIVNPDGARKEDTDLERNNVEVDKLEFPKLQAHKAIHKMMVKAEQRVPVPADSVEVKCGEDEIMIDVKQSFLGNGQFIHAPDLTLGGCPLVAATDTTLHFKSTLQNCGSTMTVSEEELVYSFSLLYKPSPIGNTFIMKTSPAEVIIECHYPRKHFVSSEDISPTWFPIDVQKLSAQQFKFSMQLMSDDWSSPRPSSVYFVNDVIHIEVSVLQGHHIPLRVFVDHCVATANPSPDSEQRYEFVNNHGCFMDSKLTGAKSFFLQRIQEDKLHLILQTFRFRQQLGNSMYLTCKLKATSLSVPIGAEHKACSFLNEARRWVASDGDNKVCACCESSCEGKRNKRSLTKLTTLQWEETVLGPIIFKSLEDDVLHLTTPYVTEAPPSASSAVLCGVAVLLSIILLMLLVAISISKIHKSHLYHVYI